MTKQRFTPAYPAELRERGVRMFRENRADYSSDTAAYKAIAPKLGCSPDSLRVWCQQAERDTGQRAGRTSADKDLSTSCKSRQISATLGPMQRKSATAGEPQRFDQSGKGRNGPSTAQNS